jgi:hypothetical protein
VDPSGATPTHADLVEDLRRMRSKGLLGLRDLTLPALRAAAGVVHDRDPETIDASMLEDLVRTAVAALGQEEPGTAAQYLFGLVQGTAGRRPVDLRERAANEYGLSVETFRKEPERRLIARVADEIIRLCLPAARAADRPADRTGPAAGDLGPSAQLDLARAIESLSGAVELENGDGYRVGRFGPFTVTVGSVSARITIDLGAVEELRDVHLVVSSENTYLEPDRRFRSTLSAQLREAASTRDAEGIVISDPVADELAAWVRAHGRPGNPHEPGIVAVTSAGELSRQGVRRLFHAAVAVPRREGTGYDLPAGGIRRAIDTCFALARAERAAQPDIDSIAIPLFGAGDGGLGAAGSFSRLWPTLSAQLQVDPSWHVHLTTWTVTETIGVLRALLDTQSA